MSLTEIAIESKAQPVAEHAEDNFADQPFRRFEGDDEEPSACEVVSRTARCVYGVIECGKKIENQKEAEIENDSATTRSASPIGSRESQY